MLKVLGNKSKVIREPTYPEKGPVVGTFSSLTVKSWPGTSGAERQCRHYTHLIAEAGVSAQLKRKRAPDMHTPRLG